MVHKRKCSLYAPSTGAWRMYECRTLYCVRMYIRTCTRVSLTCIDIYLRASVRASSGERKTLRALDARFRNAGEFTSARITSDATMPTHRDLRTKRYNNQKQRLEISLRPSRPPPPCRVPLWRSVFVQGGQPTMSRGTARFRRSSCVSFSKR